MSAFSVLSFFSRSGSLVVRSEAQVAENAGLSFEMLYMNARNRLMNLLQREMNATSVTTESKSHNNHKITNL